MMKVSILNHRLSAIQEPSVCFKVAAVIQPCCSIALQLQLEVPPTSESSARVVGMRQVARSWLRAALVYTTVHIVALYYWQAPAARVPALQPLADVLGLYVLHSRVCGDVWANLPYLIHGVALLALYATLCATGALR